MYFCSIGFSFFFFKLFLGSLFSFLKKKTIKQKSKLNNNNNRKKNPKYYKKWVFLTIIVLLLSENIYIGQKISIIFSTLKSFKLKCLDT